MVADKKIMTPPFAYIKSERSFIMLTFNLEEEILSILNARSQLHADDLFKLEALSLGRQGEEACYQLIKQYSPDHWQVFRNLNFDHYDQAYQIDLLLTTNRTTFVIEVKNYQADIEIKQTDVFYDNKELIHNPCAQVKKNYLAFQSYCHFHHTAVPTDFFLVFIHPDYSCQINHCPIKVFDRPHLRRFLQDLEANDDCHSHYNRDKLAKLINSSSTRRNFLPQVQIPPGLKKGLICPHCHSFKVATLRYTVKCQNCQHAAPKDEALQKLINQWSILNYNKDLNCHDLVDFSKQAFSKNYVWRYLKANYKKIGAGRAAHYENKYKQAIIVKKDK